MRCVARGRGADAKMDKMINLAFEGLRGRGSARGFARLVATISEQAMAEVA